MKDNLKLSKLEYHSNHLSDVPKILNLSWEEQTKIGNCLKNRQSPKEDDLNKVKSQEQLIGT